MNNDKRIAVIGAGLIGSGVAALFSLSGFNVKVFDSDGNAQANVDTCVDDAQAVMTGLGLLSVDAKKPKFYTVLDECVEGADFIIESLPEDIKIKEYMYQRLESLVAGDTVIMSCSSGLLPTKLQETLHAPERFLIAHPCNPPYLMPLVELVPGNKTTASTLDKAEALFLGVGKKVIRLTREVPGHLVNRLQAALWREAVYLVQEGYASVSDVDRAITDGLGPRWAVCGPHKVFHFAGGSEGIQGFLNRLGPAIEHWWGTLGNPVLDETTSSLLVEGMEVAMQDCSLKDELEKRDTQIVRILNLLKRTSEGFNPNER